MSPATQAIIASLLSSLFGLAGGFLLLWRKGDVRRWSHIFVSFAAGALLGAVFFDLLVDGVQEFSGHVDTLFFWVAGGFLLFFIIEKILLWHHHSHGDEDHEERKIVASLIIIGDAIHNFIDGTIIAGAYLVSPALGFTTAAAVFFHELPQEIGDFSILIHGGMRRSRVLFWNVLGACISPLGAILTILLAETIDGLELPLIGIAAGSFIYIAAADLVPEIHQERGTRKMFAQLVVLVLGMFAIYAVGQFFPHTHA